MLNNLLIVCHPTSEGVYVLSLMVKSGSLCRTLHLLLISLIEFVISRTFKKRYLRVKKICHIIMVYTLFKTLIPTTKKNSVSCVVNS